MGVLEDVAAFATRNEDVVSGTTVHRSEIQNDAGGFSFLERRDTIPGTTVSQDVVEETPTRDPVVTGEDVTQAWNDATPDVPDVPSAGDVADDVLPDWAAPAAAVGILALLAVAFGQLFTFNVGGSDA